MKIVLNDKEIEVPDGICLKELAELCEIGAGGAAIAVNNRVVRRADWPGYKVEPNDNVLLIKAAYGG